MQYNDDSTTIVLYQTEPGKEMEVMPSPELSRHIILKNQQISEFGVNPLVDQFPWLISCLLCIPSITTLSDVKPLREQIVFELKQGERNLNRMEVDKASILVIRYCLCAALDEVICRQEWGVNGGWNQNSLLSEFHNETSGGDKFFVILERLKSDPRRYHHVIEFLYLLLQAGFKGKFSLVERGGEQLDDMIQNIYHLVKEFRVEKNDKLVVKNPQVESQEKPMKRVWSPKSIVTVAGVASIIFYALVYFVIEAKFTQLLSLYL